MGMSEPHSWRRFVQIRIFCRRWYELCELKGQAAQQYASRCCGLSDCCQVCHKWWVNRSIMWYIWLNRPGEAPSFHECLQEVPVAVTRKMLKRRAMALAGTATDHCGAEHSCWTVINPFCELTAEIDMEYKSYWFLHCTQDGALQFDLNFSLSTFCTVTDVANVRYVVDMWIFDPP